MKTYVLTYDDRHVARCQVSTAGRAYWLDARLDLMNHSSGPAQLALAMLADHFAGDRRPTPAGDALAMCLYQRFNQNVFAGMPKDGFAIDSAHIRAALSIVAEAHGEPLTLTLCETLTREAARPGRPSPQLFRAQALALLVGFVGCTPRLAGKIVSAALEGLQPVTS